MENKELTPSFEIIKLLVKGCAHEDKKNKEHDCLESKFYDQDRTLWNCNYLLNQVLRQISVPETNKFVSKKAKKLWEEIDPLCEVRKNSKNINEYYYHEKIIAGKDGAKIKIYKGSSKTCTKDSPIELKKGDSFIFRDVFHVEHVVPISSLIEELVGLFNASNLTDETINKTLSKICVCRITKEEDRSISIKYERGGTDYIKIFNEYYKDKEGNKIEIEGI